MFQSALLVLALALPLASAITFNPTQHVLCGTAAVLPTDAAKRGSSQVSSGGCRTLCANENFRYTYYSSAIDANAFTCYCSNLSPVETGVTASVNLAGACASTAYAVNRLATTYTWQTCYSTAPVDSVQKYLGPDLNLCLQACAYDQWVGYSPLDTGNYDCRCGPSAPNTNNQVTCNIGRYHTLSHPADAAVSGFTKRNLRERLAMAKRAEVCPGKLEACLLGGGSQDFECIDTQSELESCGGCAYGNFKGLGSTAGVDCTSLPGVLRNAIACDQGKCVAAKCQKGYKLFDGVCKKALKIAA